MMRVLFKCLSLIIFLSCFAVTSAWACSCQEYPTPCRAFVRDDVIFVGKVIGSYDVPTELENHRGEKSTKDSRVYRFQVSEAIKGVNASSIVEANAGLIETMCFSGFKNNESYLIYAARGEDAESQMLYTGFCYRNRPMPDAQDEVELLRALKDDRPTNYIFGYVFDTTYDFEQGHFMWDNKLANIRVVIESDRHRFETLTDAEGRYRTDNLPPGEYRVTASIDEKFDEEKPRRILIGTENCPEATIFAAAISGKLRGKVFDRDNRPLAHARVTLSPTNRLDAAKTRDEDGDPKSPFWRFTDVNGEYSFDELPPGSYYLSAELDAPPGVRASRLLAFHPQAKSRAGASIVRVNAKNTTENIDIRLTQVAVRRVTGRLMWSDGMPVTTYSGASLRAAPNARNAVGGLFSTINFESDRQFSFQIIEGVDYWLSAYGYAPQSTTADGAQSKEVEATPVRVRVERNKPAPELIITLQKP